jgi:hypothetical protein
MAEGKGRDEWSRTSSLLALLANGLPVVMVSKIGHKTDPSKFNPYAEKRDVVITEKNIGDLKKEFMALPKVNRHG